MEFTLFKLKTESKSVEKHTSIQRFDNQHAPVKEGNQWFYPINFKSDASLYALKSMYEEIPEVNAPINYILDKMANIHFDHYRKNGEAKQLIENSDIMNVLDEPNQYMNKSDLIKTFFLNRLVFGVGYINRVIPFGFSEPSQLYILPSQTTKPVQEIISKKDPRLNSIKGYNTDFGEGELTLTADEVIVQYEANLDMKLDAIRSRLMSAIMTSKSLSYNYEARVKIYKDRGAIGLIAPSDPNASVTKEQAEQVRNEFNEETGITGNKKPIRVSRAAMQYTSIGFNVKDLMLNENKLQDFQTVCSVLQIDPALFGVGRDTYNNKILAKINFWEDTGQPQFNAFLELLGKVFNLPENEMLIADYSDVPALQADLEKKTNSNSKAWNDDVITEREYRESIGKEGGEELTKSQLEQKRSRQNIQE